MHSIPSALPYPQIDPIFFQIGPLAFRWYGLMYVLGLVSAFFLIRARARTKGLELSREQASDLIVFAAFGVFLGGRLGYVLFYNLPYYLAHPEKIIAVWEGGMSFHGGFIGTCVAVWLFCRRRRLPLWPIADLAASAVPIGLGLGRLGNFINGELYGRPTNVPWCMVFPTGGPVCRHPSQLYEALMEGVVLFGILTMVLRRPFPPGTVFWSFIAGYGCMRFIVELFREPDRHLGFILGPFTMGQLLSIPMILLGGLMLVRTLRTQRTGRFTAKP
ncbi:MAG: prolipoprotein diacylglyceryl transferase [Nitrospirae bacterium]|nr:MAG: prolipoprotein diacylglyceryl transferase [Nitrospirota bacterium]